MQTVDSARLVDLSGKLDLLRATLPSAITKTIITPIFPLKLPVTTTLLRGTATIGVVITPGGAPSPTAANITLAAGTLWVQASLLGGPLAFTAGLVGIPFASATLQATGSVAFGGGKIILDAAASLSVTVTSTITPATGAAGDPIGPDFLSAKLTAFSGAKVTFAPAAVSIALSGTASATLYGQSLSLTPAAAPTLVPVSFPQPHVAISCGVTQTTFTISKSTSLEVVMSGSAPIAGAGVVFPISTAAVTALPDPSDAWGIIVVAGNGLSALISPLTTPLALAGASFALTPLNLVGLVANGAARARESYLLWEPPTPAPNPPPTQPTLARPASQITLDIAPGALVSFSAAPDQEIVLALGTLNALLDRPLGADGMRIPLHGPAILTRIHTAASVTVDVGSVLSPDTVTSLALIAENALIPVGTPIGFLLSGTLSDGRIAGGLSIGFPSAAIVPTFPDPYAASYLGAAAGEQIASVAALITWTAAAPPVLTINVVPPSTPNPSGQIPGVADVQVNPVFRLLDVSSAADQWGISIGSRSFSSFTFTGLQLQAPANQTVVFTLPGISWEPIVVTGPPTFLPVTSLNDGIPTTFLVPSTAPTPIVPALALQQYQSASTQKVNTQAGFTLPFGITANLFVNASDTARPAFTIPSIQFPAQGLTGAQVLSITGAPAAQPTLPGTSITGFSKTSPAYGAQVLGTVEPSVADFWDQDFGPGGAQGFIPISRIDLSGYGTSLFSDWHDPVATDPGIIRALFNVLQGRTAHEIITAQLWVVPHCVRLQRTITFDRSDAGEVVKHDTGWKAVGPGKFELLNSSTLLPGPVVSVNNVRNIVFSTADVVVGTNHYTPCTFDADVAFSSSLQIAANGKNPAPTAVGTAIQGYAQDTISTDPTKIGPAPPSAAEIIALMQQQGRVTGQTGCIARVGGTGPQQFAFTATSFGVAVATGATPKLQTAIFGTPHLPKDGQWSVSKRVTSATTPQAVGAGTPVPLTQGTTAGATPPTGPGTFAATALRLLDPEDAQSANAPQTLYGIMQGTGTSKTLYEHPLINALGTGLGFNNNPVLADVGSLLGVANIFPEIASALQIPSTDGLPIQGDGFKKTYSWGGTSSTPPPDRALLDIAIVHLVLSYSANVNGTQTPYSGTLVLDASTNPSSWSLTLKNLSFVANVDGFGMLLTVSGGFQAGSSIKPGVTDLQVTYGPSLDPVNAILTGLSDIAASLGGSANLDVGFSGSTLSVQQGFTLPTIPLGFGEITDLGLNLGFSATIPSTLGFSVGIGSVQQPFQWVVSPLAGTGAIVLGVQGGGLNVFIEAGLGVGLSLSVAVASGSASIIVSLSLDIGTKDITISAALTGNAQVDVLGGLASTSLTLTATITITIDEPPTHADLSAQVSVGIHISICWIISISFDGSWGFSESISI